MTYRNRLYDSYAGNTVGADGLTVEQEWQIRRPYLRHFVETSFPVERNAKILDIGCGNGLLLRAAAELGYEDLAGIEQRPAHIVTDGVIIQADLFQGVARHPHGSLDAVIAFDVLEHFARDEILALLDGIHAALKPGGRVILHLPNAESPFFGGVFHGDLTHETAFTRTSIAQVLAATGYGRVLCREDRPGAGKGLKGLLRLAAWRCVRPLLRAITAIETGDRGHQAVLTRTMVVIAVK